MSDTPKPTVKERREQVQAALQQAQQQAQVHGQQATQWAQRVLYLQGQLDLLTELDPDQPAPKPSEKVLVPMNRAERRRLKAKAAS